jgi:hypothetical protein
MQIPYNQVITMEARNNTESPRKTLSNKDAHCQPRQEKFTVGMYMNPHV